MTESRTTVIVVDDHPLFRDGIARAVRERPDLELLGEAADGREALARLRELSPAVAVLDLALPGLDGLDVLNAVRRDQLPTRILILSASTDGALVHQAISAGAAGFLSKRASRADVCDALVAIARGEVVLEPELQPALIAAIQAHGVDEERPVLTPRERDVLGLMAEGLSAPAIGQRLFVSSATVKTHIGHLYEKLGVSDRAACVAEAMRRGMIE
ncbi:MAG TPA: response regulator transcription factor [Solirubrobacter sp.]|nr:response regulator transcription factor [Solirubrobacter sp.]